MAKNANNEIHVGARVKLISGSPVMAVGREYGDGTFTCQWFSGKKLETGIFPRQVLVLVDDDAEEQSS